jgi:hypothetical protein
VHFLDLPERLARPSRSIELRAHDVVLHPDWPHDRRLHAIGVNPGWPHDLPPLELAEAGDRQAVVVEHARVSEPSIDRLLEQAPTLIGLLCGRHFRVERPQPKIEALCCNHPIDQASIANLPGLQAVRFNQVGLNIDVGWLDPSLKHLGGIERSFKDVNALTRFQGLETLWLSVYGDVESLRAVSKLSSLRRIYLGGVPIAGGIMRGLVNIEEAELAHLAARDLTPLRDWKRLRRLHLFKRCVTGGIEALEALEDLVLEGPACPPISPLAALPRLHKLVIHCGKRPVDFDAVTRLRGLTSLTVHLGTHGFDIPSATLFASLTQLERLDLRGARIVNGRLGEFAALKNLKSLTLGGTYSAVEVKSLREALPDCAVEASEDGSEEGIAPRLGRVLYDFDEAQGSWSIFQDFSSEFGVDDNHQVEEIVEKALIREDPALAKRIEFDSEGSRFVAVAKTKEDVLGVAKVITKLLER